MSAVIQTPHPKTLAELNTLISGSLVEILADERIKAWINFNGAGTISIKDSFNVLSITDVGVGNYTINWNTDFANTNYCITFGGFGSMIRTNTATLLVGSAQIKVMDSAGILVDRDTICVMAIGDQ